VLPRGDSEIEVTGKAYLDLTTPHANVVIEGMLGLLERFNDPGIECRLGDAMKGPHSLRRESGLETSLDFGKYNLLNHPTELMRNAGQSPDQHAVTLKLKTRS